MLRRFAKATGLTPGEYHQRAKIARARELLEFTRDTVDQVATATGYGDSGGFRKSFKRVVGLSPSEYRRRFDASRPVSSAASSQKTSMRHADADRFATSAWFAESESARADRLEAHPIRGPFARRSVHRSERFAARRSASLLCRNSAVTKSTNARVLAGSARLE